MDEANGRLLSRIDERTANIEKQLKRMADEKVGREEFLPVRNLVYGLAGTLLVGVVVTLLSVIMEGPTP